MSGRLLLSQPGRWRYGDGVCMRYAVGSLVRGKWMKPRVEDLAKNHFGPPHPLVNCAGRRDYRKSGSVC